MQIITISDNGRIVIPAALREKYAVKGELFIDADDTGIHLMTKEQSLKRAQELMKSYSISVDDFLNDKQRDTTL